MSNPKRGDVVILSLGGKDYNALVHQVCRTEPSHFGANGEPALHLSYVPDDPINTVNAKPKTMPIGYIPASEMIYDVVHASHKFSPDYMRSHSLREVQEHDLHRVSAEAEIRSRRGAGEWREVLGRGRALTAAELQGGTQSLDLGATADHQTEFDTAAIFLAASNPAPQE